jgi:hypothetical protein
MRKKIDAADMFAVLEHQERTAHFPAATDHAACVRFHAGILERYDAAMMKADTAAAVGVIEECELFLDHVYAPFQDQRGVCYADVNGQLSKANRAPDGTIPKWGQEGNFTITVSSIPVRIEIDHLCGLGMFGENLLPHFSIHIVEKHRLFLSHTGYRSFFCTMHDTEPGVTVADAIGRILREHVQREMKGKLEPYDPYKGYSPAHRRARMIEDGMIAADEPEPEPTEEDTPVEDDDLACDGCDAPLTLVDEFMETECGTFCATCFLAHSRQCSACELDLIDDHGGTHPAPTRSGGALLPAHEAIARFSASKETEADEIDNDAEEIEDDDVRPTATANGAQISLF